MDWMDIRIKKINMGNPFILVFTICISPTNIIYRSRGGEGRGGGVKRKCFRKDKEKVQRVDTMNKQREGLCWYR